MSKVKVQTQLTLDERAEFLSHYPGRTSYAALHELVVGFLNAKRRSHDTAADTLPVEVSSAGRRPSKVTLTSVQTFDIPHEATYTPQELCADLKVSFDKLDELAESCNVVVKKVMSPRDVRKIRLAHFGSR